MLVGAASRILDGKYGRVSTVLGIACVNAKFMCR